MYGGSILYTWFYDKENPVTLYSSIKELYTAKGIERPASGSKLHVWVGSIAANKIDVAYKKLKKAIPNIRQSGE